MVVRTVLFASLLLAACRAQCTTHERRAWRDTSCADRKAYLDAVVALKQHDGSGGIPNYDTFVTVHYQNRLIAHGYDAFLPWHRWYLFKFEKALQAVGPDPCITVPYWDWERDEGMETATTVLETDSFGSSSGTVLRGKDRGCVDEGIANYTGPFSTTVRDNSCLKREFYNYQFAGVFNVMDRILSNTVFGPNAFRLSLEGYPHAIPHNFIGGHMATHHSPDDPLFFMHHANVDRIWALHQDYYGHDLVAPVDLDTDHYSGDLTTTVAIGLDDPLPFDGAGSNSDFFNAVVTTPTPRELHYSYGSIVDVTYKNDYLAQAFDNYTIGGYSQANNPLWIEIAEGDVDTIDCSGWTGVDSPTPVPTHLPTAIPTHTPTHLPTPTPGQPTNVPTFFPTKAPTYTPTATPAGSCPIVPCGLNKDVCSSDCECCSLNCKSGSCKGNGRRLGTTERNLVGPSNNANAAAAERWAELVGQGLLPEEAIRQVAREECERLGNPMGAPPQWIKDQNMENEAKVFQCFYQ